MSLSREHRPAARSSAARPRRDEITADNTSQLLDAEARSDAALAALEQARTAIAAFALVVRQGGEW